MTSRSTATMVRSAEVPALPPPPGTSGVWAWLRQNLFSSPGSTLLTLAIGTFMVIVGWTIIDWALIRAVWTGADREACAVEGAGACWPFVAVKFPQWLFGFYPIEERWRPVMVMLIGVAAFVPMLMPSVPFKNWNALFLAVAYPVIAMILLSGGNLTVAPSAYGVLLFAALFACVLLPLISGGLEHGIKSNRAAMGLAVLGLAPVLLWLVAEAFATLGGVLAFALRDQAQPVHVLQDGQLLDHWLAPYWMAVMLSPAAVFSLASLFKTGGRQAWGIARNWLIIAAALLLILFLLDADFGLEPVETSSWGGLLVTLVVSVTGIAASLPLGILLALGRRSRMPVVRLLSVIFIEVWRGVPLITVLFMSSVMLPLFLPEGVSFDRLLRALIGISLFSAAYMAEVVRGGLQAIGKGQYEGAMALGLSYWQMMLKIVLPQALKISIPNIVGNFIGLFKDTTLVMIIGIYDFLGIITAGTQDAKWATSQTANTGYFMAAIVYWVFCFGMSRYAMYTEDRLSAGTRR